MTVETTEPDLMLLQRYAQTGDAELFARIVQQYGRVVYTASMRVLDDEGAAQDVSQETFYRLMQQPHLVTISLAGWLHRTATHLALDIRRSEVARKHREKTYSLEQQRAREIQPRWSEVSPLVDQALDQLQEPARSLLVRHFLQGVSQVELAEEMNVSAATLSRRIKTGLVELQQHLKQKGVYIAVAALIVFYSDSSAQAMPATLLSELGKMQMIAAFKQLPASPVQPPALYPARFPIRHTIGSTSGNFAAALILVSLIIAAYALATTAAWVHATFVPPSSHISE